jgi:nitronate monooxygenase
MAGGPTVPALTIAAAEAGALSFLAGGYKGAAALQAEMAAVRAGTGEAFGVNLFVPGRVGGVAGAGGDGAVALAAYLRSLEPEAAAVGSVVGPGEWDDDSFGEKVDVLLADPPAIVSFTFGCPPGEVISALRDAGVLVAITVTTPDEASLAEAGAADCLCLQGSESGAHRGSFHNDDRPDQDYLLADLLAQVGSRTDLPLIAAGGIAGPDEVAAALHGGAAAAQAGTAFLRCHESGANPVYQGALADPRFTATAITRAFSGRRARSLVNRLVGGGGGAPAAYPEINNATRALRSAAAAMGDTDRMSLYAGVQFRRAEAVAAGEIVERLASGVARG